MPLERLGQFDEIVDVRTPLEFADDHVPGAINAPVLDNGQRVVVGTMYVQVGAFEATRVGAAMVARNIAHHLETTFADRPRNWRPLIYCWRGGKRSEAMTTWLNLMGWQAARLDGGYKTYRHDVIDTLEAMPAQLEFIALTGPTGSGKTRLLHALGATGAQVLDLEALAVHRGSLLGALRGKQQPSQRAFESALVRALRGFAPDRPVFVEAESRRIGRLTLPAPLFERMRCARCVAVIADASERIAFLLSDYADLFDDPAAFKAQLAKLIGLHSRDRVMRWQALIDAQARETLFRELIELHYDPAYARSSARHFGRLASATPFVFRPLSADPLAQAHALLALAAVCAAPANGT